MYMCIYIYIERERDVASAMALAIVPLLPQVIWNAKSLAKVLKQCILNRGFTDVVKHCTDALLVISVFVGEVLLPLPQLLAHQQYKCNQ